MTQPVYVLKKVKKIFPDGEKISREILSFDSFVCEKGEFIAVVGPSGSGKSTLLSILGLVDNITEGDYLIMGHQGSQLTEKEKACLRNREIGFVLQNFGLIDDMTIKDNILLPTKYLPSNLRKEAQRRLLPLVEELGIAPLLKKFPNKLSGGQKQRVAIARSLINDPSIILADEPTGNLDAANAHQVMSILLRKHQEGQTVILVTHDEALAKMCDRIVRLDSKASRSE